MPSSSAPTANQQAPHLLAVQHSQQPQSQALQNQITPHHYRQVASGIPGTSLASTPGAYSSGGVGGSFDQIHTDIFLANSHHLNNSGSGSLGLSVTGGAYSPAQPSSNPLSPRLLSLSTHHHPGGLSAISPPGHGNSRRLSANHNHHHNNSSNDQKHRSETEEERMVSAASTLVTVNNSAGPGTPASSDGSMNPLLSGLVGHRRSHGSMDHDFGSIVSRTPSKRLRFSSTDDFQLGLGSGFRKGLLTSFGASGSGGNLSSSFGSRRYSYQNNFPGFPGGFPTTPNLIGAPGTPGSSSRRLSSTLHSPSAIDPHNISPSHRRSSSQMSAGGLGPSANLAAARPPTPGSRRRSSRRSSARLSAAQQEANANDSTPAGRKKQSSGQSAHAGSHTGDSDDASEPYSSPPGLAQRLSAFQPSQADIEKLQLMRRRSRLLIWKFFWISDNGRGKAFCKPCNKLVVSNSSTLKRHLLSKHQINISQQPTRVRQPSPSKSPSPTSSGRGKGKHPRVDVEEIEQCLRMMYPEADEALTMAQHPVFRRLCSSLNSNSEACLDTIVRRLRKELSSQKTK